MNTKNDHNSGVNNDTITSTSLESLRYQSLFSNQEFKIDSNNNLHITELSPLKQRDEVVPLDLINPQLISKSRLNNQLLLLALASALTSSTFFAAAIFMGQLWGFAFAMVFLVFSIGTLIASYKNSTTSYQYRFANTETLLFSLSKPSTQDHQFELFVNALNKRIISANEKSESNEISKTELNYKGITPFDNSVETEIYMQGKQSQYMKHLDFLFNHGIVDEVLYKRLNKKIDKKIDDSENRFITEESDLFDDKTVPNNVIRFPVNA